MMMMIQNDDWRVETEGINLDLTLQKTKIFAKKKKNKPTLKNSPLKFETK